jgi:hypothetical protein
MGEATFDDLPDAKIIYIDEWLRARGRTLPIPGIELLPQWLKDSFVNVTQQELLDMVMGNTPVQ